MRAEPEGGFSSVNFIFHIMFAVMTDTGARSGVKLVQGAQSAPATESKNVVVNI